MAWTLAVGTVLGFAVLYSLMGHMTGVYRLPALDQIAPARGYLVSDGNRWLQVLLWDGRESVAGRESPVEHTTVNSGIWIKEITFVDSDESLQFVAHTPLDVIDVYVLRFGHLSEEVKKLGPKWSGP